jgi:hypothetical protein
MVLILECRSHLDLGDLPNLLAAELGVMTVRLERAIRSLDDVARVHVNRWGDGSAHLHMWFLARPHGRLQLRGTFLSLWDDILPVIPEQQWRENLALVAAWLAEFGGRANAEPPHIQWQSPSRISESPSALAETEDADEPAASPDGASIPWRPTDLADVQAKGSKADTPSTEAYAAGAPPREVAADTALATDATSPDPASRRSAIEANQPPPEPVDVDQPDHPATTTDGPTVGAQGADRSAGDSSHTGSASGEAADSGWPVSQPAQAENEPNAPADTATDNESNEKTSRWRATRLPKHPPARSGSAG